MSINREKCMIMWFRTESVILVRIRIVKILIKQTLTITTDMLNKMLFKEKIRIRITMRHKLQVHKMIIIIVKPIIMITLLRIMHMGQLNLLIIIKIKR
jgi:hypothetical protein